MQNIDMSINEFFAFIGIASIFVFMTLGYAGYRNKNIETMKDSIRRHCETFRNKENKI